MTWTNALPNRLNMCIQWSRVLYSVVIPWQSHQFHNSTLHVINLINVVYNIVIVSWYRQYWGNMLICMFSLSISDLNKCTRLATNERFCQLCCALLLRQYQNILRQREWHVGNKNVVTRGMTYDSTTRDNIKVWIVCIVVLTRGWHKNTWYC